MRSSTRGWLAAAGAAVVLAGCASNDVPPPKTELAQAESAIEQAVSADATEYAPLPLQDARKKLDQARAAAYDEDYGQARRLATEAQVDAQLALAEAQTTRAEQLAQENMRGVEVLRQELQRREGSQ